MPSRRLRASQWDLVIYGCTAAGFLGGPDSNDAHGGAACANARAPSSSAPPAQWSTCCASAGVSETAVVTPYLQPVNDGLRRYLECSGIAVETLNSFFCKTTAELGAVTEDAGA